MFSRFLLFPKSEFQYISNSYTFRQERLACCCSQIGKSVSNVGNVETIVVLSKGVDISAGKVRVEFSVEDMDLSAAHGNASYNKIKKYVYEKTGLSFFSLAALQTSIISLMSGKNAVTGIPMNASVSVLTANPRLPA